MQQDQAPKFALLCSCMASFAILGAGQAVFGPALPVYERLFGIGTAEAGLLISAFWVGCFLGVAALFVAASHVGPRLALIALSLGGLLLAIGLYWVAALAGALIFGLGYGSLAALFNPRILRAFGPKGPAMVSLVNAMFSVGAIVAPLGFVWMGSHPQVIFGMVAVAAAAVAVTAGRAGDAEPATTQARQPLRLHLPIMGFGMLAIGMEASLIGLGPTALVRAGIEEARAAELLSLFFVTFLSGRILLVFVAHLIPSFAVYVLGMGFAAICALGAALVDPALFFPPMGISCGLFFPGYFVTGSRKMGDDARVAPVLIGTGLVGAILSPLILAQLIGQMGDRGYFWLIALVTGTLALTGLAALRAMNR